MSLRTKFILFIVLIHAVLLILSTQLLTHKKLLFFLAEIFIILSIAISIRLYKEFIRPLNLISSGIESMKDQDFNTKFVKVGQIEMDQLIDMYNKMISQLRDERIIQQEQHYFLDRLIQASPSGIIILDFDEKITSMNPAAEALLRLNGHPALGNKLTELEGDLPAGLSHLDTDGARIIKLNGIKAYKCQKSHFIDRGFHHHFILIEELTDQILKAEKQAYDKVIRMMSHEINNSLGAINSILNSSLNYKTQLKAADREDYENALQVAIERNNKLNRFMTNFADVVRTPQPSKELFDLNKLLKNVHTIMSAECQRRNISVNLELVSNKLEISMDAQQMEQVMVNILKNSIEAIEKNGRLIIRTQNQPIRSLSILDNGRGISKELQQKLFTPFFSTKKGGQGIGLTLVREILINHGFHFALFMNSEGYTEFRIEFGSQL